MIEIIIMIGVISNAVLQTYWFFWSRSIQQRKHKDDEFKNDIDEALKNLEEMQNKFNTKVNTWNEFNPSESNETLTRNEHGKYNPDEIKGHFDGFFTPEGK